MQRPFKEDIEAAKQSTKANENVFDAIQKVLFKDIKSTNTQVC